MKVVKYDSVAASERAMRLKVTAERQERHAHSSFACAGGVFFTHVHMRICGVVATDSIYDQATSSMSLKLCIKNPIMTQRQCAAKWKLNPLDVVKLAHTRSSYVVTY